MKTEITPDEQALIREVAAHPGMKILAREFKKFGRDAFIKKNLCNPMENPGSYYKYDALHRAITVLIPTMVEGLTNYQEGAPDNLVEPQKRWSIFDWFRK
jgi:hypothetical protein